jgi:hypothetical protein
MEGSLLAVQLLVQGAVALHQAGEAKVLPSARKILLEIRAEIRNVTGMYLGPRQRRPYWQRLQQARGDTTSTSGRPRAPALAEPRAPSTTGSPENPQDGNQA